MTRPFERVRADEWLDEDSGSPAEIASALRSLRWVNRLFGGNHMHRRLLKRAVSHVQKDADLHIMEVASGRGEVLQSAAVHLDWPKDRMRITLLDRSAIHLPSSEAWPASLSRPECLTANALEIPLPDDSVDVIANCLFLHHLSEAEVVRYLREALRVARVAVIINDLERNGLHHCLARLMSLVDPSRLSKHDGPVSVRQAYTFAELAEFARATGHRFELRRGYLFRLGLVVWK